jgi:hypothetical protein
MSVKYYVFFVSLIVYAWGVFSCVPSDTGNDIQFGERFRVEYDQTVRLQDGTEIRFLDLKKDTRCPEDALCAYEGEALIVIALEHDNRLGSVIELSIPGLVDVFSEKRHISKSYWGYEFTLMQLDPYPLVDQSEMKQRYVATLIVDRDEGEERK